ncbi:septation protein SepH [Nocardioides solisilvae]|uniref:septation protein SepH n=1 Tax=Nocardioides solisilvae TaxID=1542435 RepID=UPI0013A58CD2|nr:septation protein SepH [Nocardioides solisilvae]
MAHLTLVGLSEDRTRLRLVDDAGVEHTLAADATLRAALRGEDPRPGHLENRMDSALRPRDIQARIRAGETPEAVADAAGSTVEKIMPYATPVLAERAHVAERAQRSSVRRRSSEGSGSLGGGRTLEETVSAHLRSENVDPGSVEWDAFRREDGRWTLTGAFASPARRGTATFTFDVPGNYVTVEDDDARWLVGETPARPAAPEAPPAPEPEAHEAPTGTPRRRLSAVPAEELPLGDDAIEMLAGGQGSPAATAPAGPHDETADLSESLPVEAFLTDEPARSTAAAEEAPAEEPAAREQADERPTPRRPVRKSRGRASVPSWDEIMFGGGSGD